MGFSDRTTFPKGIWYSDLTSDPTTAFAAGATRLVNSIVITNTAVTDDTITITDGGAGSTKAVVFVAADSTVIISAGWQIDNGLDFAGGGASVHVTVFYFEP